MQGSTFYYMQGSTFYYNNNTIYHDDEEEEEEDLTLIQDISDIKYLNKIVLRLVSQ